MIPIIKERIVQYLQGNPDIDEEKLGLDHEREHTLLMNLFTSGNYARAGGTDWDDRGKERTDDTREEFELTMKEYGYVQSGFNSKKDNEKPGKNSRHIDFKYKVERNEDITVTMTDLHSGNRHTFLFTKGAIMGFFYEHPITSRYQIPAFVGQFKKHQNAFCCQPSDEQLIRYDGQKETITAVYRNCKDRIIERLGADDEIVPEVSWQFTCIGDDVLNFALGDEIRYCAFCEAFMAALIACSRGIAYSDLYQAVCYGVAV